MKIGMITDTFLPQTNGVVNSICNQIKGLTKEGHEVVVIAPGEKTKLVEYHGAKIYYIRSNTTRLYPGYRVAWPHHIYNTVLTLLEIEQPDIFHIQTPLSLGLAGLWYARRLKKDVIATYHTHIESYTAHLTKGRLETFVKKLLGMPTWRSLSIFFNLCNKTLVPGKEMEKELNKHKIENTVVVPNGMNLKKFENKKLFDLKKKYNLPKDAKIILNFGRVSFEKKINLLLKAFKEIEKENKKIYLFIVGKGPWLEKLKKHARKLKLENVIFTGFVEDKLVPSFYKKCDFFATASDTEVCPLVLMDALAAGIPIIGPNKFGTKDMIKHGKNGYLFEAGNWEDLTRTIKKMLEHEDKWNEMGKESLEMSKKYSQEKVIKKLIHLYENPGERTISPWGVFVKKFKKIKKSLRQNL